MQGTKLAGGNPENGRVAEDFYATDPAAVDKLFAALDRVGKYISPKSFLEPCVGNGNIADRVLKLYPAISSTMFTDIVDRGYPNTVVGDFLTADFGNRKFDLIVSNPPYSLALEFVQKCRSLLTPDGILAMFLKIQYWEGEKRQADLWNNPPAFCFPFSKRMATWNNGKPTDGNGKRWATTMCHAWFVWDTWDSTRGWRMCGTMPI